MTPNEVVDLFLIVWGIGGFVMAVIILLGVCVHFYDKWFNQNIWENKEVDHD